MTDRQFQVKAEPVLAGPETVTADRWHQPFTQPLVNAARLAAVVLAVTAGAVAPVAPVAPPSVNTGWIGPLSEPARPPRGLNAALQSAFTVDAKVLTLKEATTADRWFIPLSEPVRFAKSAALQPSFTVDAKALTLPETTTVSRWFAPLSEPARPPRGLSPVLQQSFTVDAKALTLKESTSADRWFVQWKDPLKGPPPSSLQEDGFFAPNPLPNATVFADRWFQILQEPVRSKPGLTAALQSSTVIDPLSLTRSEITTVDRWFTALSEPGRTRRFNTATQQQPVSDPTPVVVSIGWLSPFADPIRTARQSPPTSATFVPVDVSFGWFAPLSVPTPPRADATRHPAQTAIVQVAVAAPVTLDGWYQPWSVPPRRPAVAHQQAFSLIAVVTPPLDSWYRRLEEPVRLRPALAPALRQSTAIDAAALTRPEATTVDRWIQWLSEPLRPARGLPAYLQVSYAKDANLPPPAALTTPDEEYTVALPPPRYTVALQPPNYTVSID